MTSPETSDIAPAEKGEFRTEIDDLARSAEREWAEREKGIVGRGPGERRRLTGILWAGGLLIALEAGFLVFQLAVNERAPAEHEKPHPLQSVQTCAGERYRTFRALVSYRREFGHWPDTLAEIVGPYAPKLPADPETGIPLEYERTGETFSLTCAKP